jgi:HD-like signal output (HDOD) protein
MRDIAGRLGTKRAYYMIMTHVINKLFLRQPGELIEALKPYQKHSLEVAAISRVLAKITPGIDPDMAMLAGMSHEIGSVVIMNFLINNDNFSLDPDESAQAVNTLGPEFTSLLLKRWQFNDEIVQAAEGSEDWFRNQGDAIDLCDLVLVANYHTLMNTDRVATLPPVSTLPVMKKLKITQDESITLIEKSSSEREKIARMLRF